MSRGLNALNYEDALDAAEATLADPKHTRNAAEAAEFDCGFNLDRCPWGDVYTVGHALWDHAEWIRLGGSWAHFLGVRTRCNCYLLPAFGDLPADDMNQAQLRKFVEDFFSGPTSPELQHPMQRGKASTLDEETLAKRKRTLNMLIGQLRSALKMAWEDGKISNEHAWRGLRFVPYVKRRRLQYLTLPEAQRLLEACDPDLEQLVRGALYTGCRASELLKMRVKDVARDGFGVYVCPVKSYRPRFVFLSDEGMEFFLDLVEGAGDYDFVFKTRTGRMWSYRYGPRFKRAIREAGLDPEFSFHGLRHTYATWLVQAGTPLSAISDQLGHSGPETVMMTYGHFAPQIRETEIRERSTSLSFAQSDPRLPELVEERFLQRTGKSRVRYADLKPDPNTRRINFIRGDPAVARFLRAGHGAESDSKS